MVMPYGEFMGVRKAVHKSNKRKIIEMAVAFRASGLTKKKFEEWIKENHE